MKHSKLISLLLVTAMAGSVLTGCSEQTTTETSTYISESEVLESEVEVTEESEAISTPTPTPEPVRHIDPDTPELEGYDLLWSDEFNGDALDTSIWNQEVRQAGWTNNELQAYTNSEENVYVEDGRLVIRAIQNFNDNGEAYYTSGKVTGRGHTDFMYGRIEVSAKVPEGQGLWPAIWMMPYNESLYGSWPRCGEIDIMESLGHQTEITYSTIHYGNPHAQQQGTYTLDEGTFADDFHVYALEWEPGAMRFYVDDVLVASFNDWFTGSSSDNAREYPAPFDQLFFLQLNLAVGGNWPGDPDETTDFNNATFEVDYVRCYQLPEYDTNVERPPMTFRDAAQDGNLIWNADLSEEENLYDDDLWSFLTANGGAANAEVDGDTIVITTEEAGTDDYSVQLVQADLPMINGNAYTVTFEACADEDRTMNVDVSGPHAGYIRYMEDTTVDLTSSWQTYQFVFTMMEDDDNYGRIEFNMGATDSTATIRIRNVRIEITE